MIFALCGLVALMFVGCDEGMNMIDDVVVIDPIDEPPITDPKDPGEPEKPIQPPPEPIEPSEHDFTGQDGVMARAHARPVAGVTLTVVSGERSVIDKQGNYRFSDPTGETLQLRL